MKNLKNVFVLIVCLILVLSLTACKNSEEKLISDLDENDSNDVPIEDENTSEKMSNEVEQQLKVIADHYEEWKRDEYATIYGYAITDFNHNGRLEIVASSLEGSGLYTYTDIYEVTEDYKDIKLWETDYEEGESQVDIMDDSEINAYYDAATNTYHYLMYDYIRVNATEGIEGKRDIVFKDGKIIQNYLASNRVVVLDDENTQNEYTNASGDIITEEEYNSIENEVYKDFAESVIEINFIMNDDADFENINSEDLLNLLRISITQ